MSFGQYSSEPKAPKPATPVIKTFFRTYRFDISKPADKIAYEKLVEKLTGHGLKCFETWGGKNSHWMPKLDGKTILLETAHLFDNQWNTAPIEEESATGLRVFDWAQDYLERPIGNPNIKQGHWLEQTEEMREARRNTHACGPVIDHLNPRFLNSKRKIDKETSVIFCAVGTEFSSFIHLL